MTELELRDIHLPEAVSWWPPAVGWWVLLLLLVVLLLLIYFGLKRLKQVSVRKSAMAELEAIKASFKQSQNKTALSQQLSQLLRKMLLSSYGREEVASVSGERWLNMLKSSHPKGELKLEWLELLANASYQKQAEFDATSLLKNIQRWVSTYPKRHLL